MLTAAAFLMVTTEIVISNLSEVSDHQLGHVRSSPKNSGSVMTVKKALRIYDAIEDLRQTLDKEGVKLTNAKEPKPAAGGQRTASSNSLALVPYAATAPISRLPPLPKLNLLRLRDTRDS